MFLITWGGGCSVGMAAGRVGGEICWYDSIGGCGVVLTAGSVVGAA